MINSGVPVNWQNLQNDVAQILYECGLSVETERIITTARGEVEIDIFAEEPK